MGGLYYICAFTIAFGFSTGSQIIMARRNGERNYKEVGPVMIQGVFFLFMLAAVMFTLSRLFAGDIMRILISSDTILNATEEFLDWRVFGFFFSFVNVMFPALFKPSIASFALSFGGSRKPIKPNKVISFSSVLLDRKSVV